MKWGKYVFAAACASLPWAGLVPVSVYLLIATGIVVVASGKIGREDVRQLLTDPLTILFFAFYASQLLGLVLVPGNEYNRFSVEQKASLLFVPVLLSFYHKLYADGWGIAVKSFIAGTVIACLHCLMNAVVVSLGSGTMEAFFYHLYSSAVGANAIYLSVYIIAAICMLIYYQRKGIIQLSRVTTIAIVAFLYGNMLLLSSKLHIIVGGAIIFILLSSSIKRTVTRYAASVLILCSVLAFSFLDNPIGERYQQVHVSSYRSALHATDFSHHSFNGLDLRILLWRMGAETLTEHNNWVLGEGGRAYHQTLNSKMQSYHLYSGNVATGNTGYLNYNLHNQYMENTVQFGLVGLAILLGIIVCIAVHAWKTSNQLLLLLTAIFSIAFLTESVLETQAGILLFTIFIYGEWKRSKYANCT